MKKKTAIVLLALAAALAAAVAFAYRNARQPMQPDGQQIFLQLQLDLKEDIGLLIIESDIDGSSASGGISNADQSMLKKDETLYWTIDQQGSENLSDTVELSLRFTIITAYCNPNYENVYPEEYTMPLEAVSVTAKSGGTYAIRIVGDKANGYRAAAEAISSYSSFFLEMQDNRNAIAVKIIPAYNNT